MQSDDRADGLDDVETLPGKPGPTLGPVQFFPRTESRDFGLLILPGCRG